MFDIAAFSNATFSEANDTTIVSCPEGEYVGIIEKPEVRAWKSREGDKSGLALDYMVCIDDPQVTAVTGRTPTRVRGGAMLDLTDAGSLDMGKGKNVGLGRLREAAGLNVPGQPFSFSMLAGKAIRAKIATRVDGDKSYDEVKAVAKL